MPAVWRGGLPPGRWARTVGSRHTAAAGARATGRRRARRARHDQGAPLSMPSLWRDDHGHPAGHRTATPLRRDRDRSGPAARRDRRRGAHRRAAACQPVVHQLRRRHLDDRSALASRHRPGALVSVGPPQSHRFFASATGRTGRDDAHRARASRGRGPRGRRHGRRRAGCVMANASFPRLMSGPTPLDPRSAERLALGCLCGRCGVTGAERTRRARTPQTEGQRGSGSALSQ